jgi:methyl-accepting chemotaxis protein
MPSSLGPLPGTGSIPSGMRPVGATDSRGFEFFRYHGLWAPGVRLFRSIGFSAKAGVIALTFLVPMAALTWSFFSTKAEQIDFSAKERVGVRYAQQLMPLLDLLQRQRLYAVQAAVQGPSAPELAGVRAALQTELSKLAALQAETGEQLGSAKNYQAFLAATRAAAAASGKPDAVFDAHSGGIQSFLDLLGETADGSNLTLDPDIDSYYAMDAALKRLPLMIEAAGQLHGYGARMLAAQAATPAQTRRLLEQRADLQTPEAARLMHTVVEMQHSLRRIVGQVRRASDSIVSASAEIASGSMDLSARTEASAAELQQTAATMEEIAATVKRSEEAVKAAAELAVSNAQAAEQGGQLVGQVVVTMQDINQSASRIVDIIGTIEGIAFQTNILALNAAVEAARAGAQGRGFAVVAAEVRALAQRSSAAAREINTLITASVAQVEGGVGLVRQAGETIAMLVGSSQRVRGLLSDISVAEREQSAGVAQSAKAVQAMDVATQQNTALVEQTAAAAGSLNDQALGLAQEAAQFRLPTA